jgi:hypothetical protein
MLTVSMRRTIMVTSCIVLSACCTLSDNPVVRFKEYHDNCYVGKTLHEYMWFKKRQVGEFHALPTLPGHSEITYEKDACRWAVVIEQKTTRIVSWRYISEPSECKFPKPPPGHWFHI